MIQTTFIISCLVLVVIIRLQKHPKILFGGDFFNMVLVTKTLYVGGRFGGGKTALAFILSAELYQRGWIDRILTNVPSVLAEPSAKAPIERCSLVIDEAHQFLDEYERAKHISAYLRKFESFLFCPSVFPPHRRLTVLSCQRIYNGYTLGLPLWVYKWQCVLGFVKEEGYFCVLRPDKIFGYYDTSGIPSNDGGIFKALHETFNMRKVKSDANTTIPQEEKRSEAAKLATALSDAAAGFEEALERSAREARKASKRR